MMKDRDRSQDLESSDIPIIAEKTLLRLFELRKSILFLDDDELIDIVDALIAKIGNLVRLGQQEARVGSLPL